MSATIPRLELLAVALGTRIIEFLRQESEVKNVYLWTDSACAIHWIKKPPIGLRYVTNRITEIRGVKGIIFHHVKTADNPADLASRGVLPKVLKDSSLWWNGPSWLVHPLENWPREEFGEEVQERICRALELTTCTKLTSAIRTTIVDVKRF
uniref:RNase H domain-containing protein n=2 Tax=Onchocerca ochengi TaxID=42157 RepID=A0A182EXJ3_ONCOC